MTLKERILGTHESEGNTRKRHIPRRYTGEPVKHPWRVKKRGREYIVDQRDINQRVDGGYEVKVKEGGKVKKVRFNRKDLYWGDIEQWGMSEE